MQRGAGPTVPVLILFLVSLNILPELQLVSCAWTTAQDSSWRLTGKTYYQLYKCLKWSLYLWIKQDSHDDDVWPFVSNPCKTLHCVSILHIHFNLVWLMATVGLNFSNWGEKQGKFSQVCWNVSHKESTLFQLVIDSLTRVIKCSITFLLKLSDQMWKMPTSHQFVFCQHAWLNELDPVTFT